MSRNRRPPLFLRLFSLSAAPIYMKTVLFQTSGQKEPIEIGCETRDMHRALKGHDTGRPTKRRRKTAGCIARPSTGKAGRSRSLFAPGEIDSFHPFHSMRGSASFFFSPATAEVSRLSYKRKPPCPVTGQGGFYYNRNYSSFFVSSMTFCATKGGASSYRSKARVKEPRPWATCRR